MQHTFRKRLLLAHASVVVVIVLGTATGLIALRSTIRQTERTSEIDGRLAIVDHLRSNAREVARSARRYLLTGDLQEQQRVRAIEAEMKEQRGKLAIHARALADELDNYVGTIAASLTMETTDTGPALARFEDDLVRARGPLGAAFDEVTSRERATLEASRSSQRLARGAQWGLVIAAALGILLTVGSTLAMRHGLQRHAERTSHAERVAEGVSDQRKELLSASDELRGPLASIIAQTAELGARDRPEEERRILESMAAAASRVDDLLRQLLDVTAIQTGAASVRREPCNVPKLVDRALEQHRGAARERGIRLRHEAEQGLTVSADPTQIKQVLSSLLELAIASARIGAEIVASAAPTEDGVRIAVIDAGSMPLTPSLFPPAVAAPPNDLALHLSRRVIEAHGGRFGIDATTAGRTYWFTLPTEPRMLR